MLKESTMYIVGALSQSSGDPLYYTTITVCQLLMFIARLRFLRYETTIALHSEDRTPYSRKKDWIAIHCSAATGFIY